MTSRLDNYEVVCAIGSGSFGEVYLVEHRKEQRQYVMKRMNYTATMKPKDKEAAELEVKLLQTLRHPNIVAYKDSFLNEDENLCIFMEYCEHGDLYQHLQNTKKAGSMPAEPTIIEWYVQVVLAMNALHEKNILHRDLKTQNIFLTSNDGSKAFALKLGDFGIAKVLDSEVAFAVTRIGTPFYMSPELFNNKPYSYKSDIWGLGCILYEMINGKHAFDAQSLNGLALRILKGRYTPCTAKCSKETKDLIKSLLSVNPSHRPTLKESLHLPFVRRRIATVVKNVVMSSKDEQQLLISQVLTEQLQMLGLGNLINAGVVQNLQKDSRKLLQRLEKARSRKRKEEETLRRLEETAMLLTQTLERAEKPPHNFDECMAEASSSRFDEPSLSERKQKKQVGRIKSLPVMSHRDQVLQQKEQRRREEEQRFEEEAQKIREENLAFQRNLHGSKDRFLQGDHNRHDLSGVQAPPRSSRQPSPPPQEPVSAFTGASSTYGVVPPGHEDPARPILPMQAKFGPRAHSPGLDFLLEYDHITPLNLANPFQSGGGGLVHSPKVRQAGHRLPDDGPRPPLPQFGLPPNPHPPGGLPPANHSYHRGFFNGGNEPPLHASRPLHSVCLEALNIERRPNQENSEDDNSCGELSDYDSSDGGWGGGQQQIRQRVSSVHDQIDQCKSAIYKHRMTIETLQYSVAQNRDPGRSEAAQYDPAGNVSDGESSQDNDSSMLSIDGSSLDWLSSAEGMQNGNVTSIESVASVAAESRPRVPDQHDVPAIVLDRIARLTRRCVEGLGNDRFYAARRRLAAVKEGTADPSQVRAAMVATLGSEMIGFLALIDQVLHMEQQYGRILE